MTKMLINNYDEKWKISLLQNSGYDFLANPLWSVLEKWASIYSTCRSRKDCNFCCDIHTFLCLAFSGFSPERTHWHAANRADILKQWSASIQHQCFSSPRIFGGLLFIFLAV